MRNGDYSPTRLEAQLDAVQLLTNAKLQSNVENSVAIMAMGGASPKVLVTLTSEQGKLLHAISSVAFEGQSANLKSAIQVGQLVLKHRQNGNQRQRIVVFVGSPLTMTLEEAEQLNKILRKNNISLDVISLGPVTENDSLLEYLVATEQEQQDQEEEGGNHLLRVFQGQGSIVETLASSPIVRGNNTSGAGDFAFGVDPEMDPELAMALKLSMEEEMARQTKVQADEPAKQEVQQEPPTDQMDEDEDALLQQAIALSMQQQQNNQ